MESRSTGLGFAPECQKQNQADIKTRRTLSVSGKTKASPPSPLVCKVLGLEPNTAMSVPLLRGKDGVILVVEGGRTRVYDSGVCLCSDSPPLTHTHTHTL